MHCFVTGINYNCSETDHIFDMKKKVVILGAGHGGIFAVDHLCKENKHFSVSLIDNNPYLQLLQQIPYIISGSKRQEDITVKSMNYLPTKCRQDI
jgi:NADH dehydrogenase FAD-containing subunit